MTGKIVTVFGGSGFVGRLVVRALCRHGWRVRVAMRRPHVGGDLRLAGDVGQVQLVQANVRNRASIARALEGADAAVNLVGILVEHGAQSFQGTQALGAANIAKLAAEAGIKRFVYMSSIGADANSRSNYARTKAEAEAGDARGDPDCDHPAPIDHLRTGGRLLHPLRRNGADDARAADDRRLDEVPAGLWRRRRLALTAALEMPDAQGKTYELGGPSTYTMKQLLQYIMREIDRPRLLLPIPFTIASPLGYTNGALASLPAIGWVFGPVITGDQVQMLRRDNVASPKLPGLADLGVTSRRNGGIDCSDLSVAAQASRPIPEAADRRSVARRRLSRSAFGKLGRRTAFTSPATGRMRAMAAVSGSISVAMCQALACRSRAPSSMMPTWPVQNTRSPRCEVGIIRRRRHRLADAGRLHVAVAQNLDAGRLHRHLHQAGTIEPDRIAPAPEIGRAKEALGDGDEIRFGLVQRRDVAG